MVVRAQEIDMQLKDFIIIGGRGRPHKGAIRVTPELLREVCDIWGADSCYALSQVIRIIREGGTQADFEAMMYQPVGGPDGVHTVYTPVGTPWAHRNPQESIYNNNNTTVVQKQKKEQKQKQKKPAVEEEDQDRPFSWSGPVSEWRYTPLMEELAMEMGASALDAREEWHSMIAYYTNRRKNHVGTERSTYRNWLKKFLERNPPAPKTPPVSKDSMLKKLENPDFFDLNTRRMALLILANHGLITKAEAAKRWPDVHEHAMQVPEYADRA